MIILKVVTDEGEVMHECSVCGSAQIITCMLLSPHISSPEVNLVVIEQIKLNQEEQICLR